MKIGEPSNWMDSEGRDRGVITMAFGKPRFIEMAKWLAMSLRLNSPNIARAILTDCSDPELGRLFHHVIPYKSEMGNHMEPKFHLDQFSPFHESLYVDSDCLAVKPLDALFDLFRGHSFGVPGWRYLSWTDHDAAVDVPFVLEHFKIGALPKFNGGCYYFRKCPETTEFFNTARGLLANARELRIGFYPGGGFSDEPLFAIALTLHEIGLTPTGTGGPWTPINSRGPMHLDILSQTCHFDKEGATVYPDIVHFPAGYRECYAYQREVWKLKQHFGMAAPRSSERIKALANGIKWRILTESKLYAKKILRRPERRDGVTRILS